MIDTIRLHRLINTFNILHAGVKIRIRKYSSREIFIREKPVQKMKESNISKEN